VQAFVLTWDELLEVRPVPFKQHVIIEVDSRRRIRTEETRPDPEHEADPTIKEITIREMRNKYITHNTGHIYYLIWKYWFVHSAGQVSKFVSCKYMYGLAPAIVRANSMSLVGGGENPCSTRLACGVGRKRERWESEGASRVGGNECAVEFKSLRERGRECVCVSVGEKREGV
jgi:hypothetical protein